MKILPKKALTHKNSNFGKHPMLRFYEKHNLASKLFFNKEIQLEIFLESVFGKSKCACRCLHFWHNCCFLESSVSLISCVCILTWLLLPWEQCFIDLNNNELAGWMTLTQRTIVPCWKDAVGLGSIVCHTKSKKKWWKRQPICWWRTFHQREEAIKHDSCKGCFEQWWANAYSNWHNRTTVLYTKYVHNTKNYFPPEPKN